MKEPLVNCIARAITALVKLTRTTSRLSVIVLLLCATKSYGAIYVVADRSVFDAETAGLSTIDFNSYSSGALTNYSTPSGLTATGIEFVGNVTGGGNFLYAIQPAYYPPIYDQWPTGSSPTVLQGPGSAGAVAVGELDVSGPLGTAVGTGFYTVTDGIGPVPQSVQVYVDTGFSDLTFTVPTSGAPTIDFIGIIDTESGEPIQDVSFTAGGTATYPNLSDFQYGEFVPAPEPSGLVLVALGGLAAIGCRALLRRKANAV
ncbi:MAG TPA: hypothetical protein VMJ32_14600 [Pirellulales bacterium]|nr:hypothetical protein [Pirellulales bacterium]